VSTPIKKWRGVVALLRDAVEHGSRAVEKVQLETAKRPFVVLEHIPAIATPTKVVHVAHDASVKTVHGIIRGVNAIVGTSIDVVLEHVDSEAPEAPEAPEPPGATEVPASASEDPPADR